MALSHIPDTVNVNLQTEGYERLVKGISQSKPVFVYSEIVLNRTGLTDLKTELDTKLVAKK